MTAMAKEEILNEGALTIEEYRSDSKLVLVLSGKSIIRDPTATLMPVFVARLGEVEQAGGRLVLDFRAMTYIDSSSFAPVIKILEKARIGSAPVTVIYSGEQNWQEISFAAMSIFKTSDGRIDIRSM